ncbi:YcxB family protein [Pseudomonas sp. TWP3-2]|uniref:YcxB family protein n=1 Tax=Pseudomonas sp. TWP3-2 TaxID=2804574 RepID=UPI003CF5C5C4
MELQFTITPEHTQMRIGKLLEQEMLKDDQLHARVTGCVNRQQDRLLAPLMFFLGLGAGALAIYFPARELSPQKIISMALFAMVFGVCWWLFSRRLLGRLRNRIASNRAKKPRMPFRSASQRLIELKLRTQLKATEGAYRLEFDEHGFTLINMKGKSTQCTLAWAQIVRLKMTPDFYCIACAKLDSKGKAYHIPRHSDVMDADMYQQGLEVFLSRVPVPAS